jgi:hypothetical protein
MGDGLKKMDEYEAGGGAAACPVVEPAGQLGAGGRPESCVLSPESRLPVAVQDFWAEFAAMARACKAAEAVVREAIAAGDNLAARPTAPMAILARRLSDVSAIRMGVRS